MGFDLKRHNGTIETLIPPVMAWLLTRPEAVGELTPQHVIAAFAKFEAAVRELRIVWSKEVPWPTLLQTAQLFIPTLSWSSSGWAYRVILGSPKLSFFSTKPTHVLEGVFMISGVEDLPADHATGSAATGWRRRISSSPGHGAPHPT